MFGQTNRRAFIAGLLGVAAWPIVPSAQQSVLPVIGFFSSRSPSDSDYLIAALRRGLAEQGYIEGKNVKIEYRWAQGQWDRLSAIVTDLLALNAAVIVAAGGEPAAFAAKAATSTVPIVFSVGGDPVKEGIVASLSHPGENATGVTLMTSDLEEKRIGILHELLPDAELVGVLTNSKLPPLYFRRAAEDAARAIGQRIKIFEASNEAELDCSLISISKSGAKVILVTADPFFDTQRARIVRALAQYRLPALYQFREYVVAGGLMSYGPDIANNYRQLGIYAGRILKGEKPADLPIVRSTKFEFVINLKTANALGLAIPPMLLARADEVIE
jgi:putative tryptophan/tyrosine transport system substrate-binding protein